MKFCRINRVHVTKIHIIIDINKRDVIIVTMTPGKNLTMRIDAGQSRTIMNEGSRQHMNSDEHLYLGGLPADVRDSALKKWHIRKITSFHGQSVSHAASAHARIK